MEFVNPDGSSRKATAQEILTMAGVNPMPTPRKHSTPEDRLSMIHDPSHGWLVVPIADVEASGIEVSEFSYKDSSNYYLEEDRDAVRYLASCGYKFGAQHRDRIDIDHRHYKSIDFENGAVRCAQEVN